MIGYGVKPSPSFPVAFVSSYGSNLGRVALLLDQTGFRVYTGGVKAVPVGGEVNMMQRVRVDHGLATFSTDMQLNGSLTMSGVLTLNGYATAQNRAQDNGYLKFNGIIIAWGRFTANGTNNQTITMPSAGFTTAPRIALTLLTSGTDTTFFVRVAGITTTTFKCNSNTNYAVMYIAIGI
jgi:hypothetical protein